MYVLYSKPTPSDSQANSADDLPTTSEQASTSSPEQPGNSALKPGEYTDYSTGYFDQTAQNSRRILFFHAAWCPQCRALENDIRAKGVPAGMVIFKVNYDTESGLKQRYGVTLQTTLVEVDAAGNLVRKHVAYDQPTLDASLKALGD